MSIGNNRQSFGAKSGGNVQIAQNGAARPKPRRRVIEEKEKALKQAILEEMEAKNILKIENDDLVLNYIAPTDRETFDSKSFKEDHQDMYDEYIKMTPVKSSVRIKLK